MINNESIALIKCFESLHDGDLSQIGLQPKMCPAGIWTVAFGRALRTKDGKRFLKGNADKAEAYRQYPALTEAEAEAMLQEDLAIFAAHVAKLVKVPLSENQRGALVSFAYNCGHGALASSTLLKKLNAGDYDGAAAEFKRWNKAGGKVLRGLTRRREAEAALFMGKGYAYVSAR
jgi:lysozyme